MDLLKHDKRLHIHHHIINYNLYIVHYLFAADSHKMSGRKIYDDSTRREFIWKLLSFKLKPIGGNTAEL